MSLIAQPDFDLSQYLGILDLTFQVVQSLDGKPSPDPRLADCQHLAAKLFFHAATIYHLRQGTKAPLASLTNGADFSDCASVAVITRSALETYLTMQEVFFEPVNEDEFEFNHALWQLSDAIVLENYVPSNPVLRSQAANAQQQIQALKKRLQKTAKFASMKHGEQKEALKGKRKRNWKCAAKVTGIEEKIIRLIYAYASGFVHAGGLTTFRIMAAQSAKKQIDLFELFMRPTMYVMLKMVLDYAKKFPEAKAVLEKNTGLFLGFKSGINGE